MTSRLKTESIPISVYPYIPLWLTIYVIRFFADHCKKKTYLLHIATMCLAAVAQRKMVTICHLSSSSRHLKKVQRAGRQSSSFTVESSGVTRKKVSLYRPCTWRSMVEKVSIHIVLMEITWTCVNRTKKSKRNQGKMIEKSIILILKFETWMST